MFVTQLELALELNKPVIIHDREAHEDCLRITARYPALRGVFHCFSGSLEMAKELVKRGWHLGFDGPITYKNARKALEVLEWCPLERILIETDSPYLTPVPFRGKRNDSGKLRYIVEKIAEIKGLSHEDTARATAETPAASSCEAAADMRKRRSAPKGRFSSSRAYVWRPAYFFTARRSLATLSVKFRHSLKYIMPMYAGRAPTGSSCQTSTTPSAASRILMPMLHTC